MTPRKRIPAIDPVLKVAKRQAKIVRETIQKVQAALPADVTPEEMEAQIFDKLRRDPGGVVRRYDDEVFDSWLNAQLRLRRVKIAPLTPQPKRSLLRRLLIWLRRQLPAS